MKKRKLFPFAIILSVVILLVSSCNKISNTNTNNEEKKDKISISMYMWDRSMFKEFTPWLEAKFPNIEFTFVQSFNTMDYYNDILSRQEALPDIITCRRFSLNDAKLLSPYLMDLSTSEVASSFYSSYLELNREQNGTIKWLPMCAEVDCILANKTLFDKYNIPIPTNYSEFVSAIDAFEAAGIRGFLTDWRYDYTCLEIMQGSAIPELMSLEGTKWRMDYESESDDLQVGLDSVVWPKVFENFEQFIKDIHFRSGDEELNFNGVYPLFLNGEIAMIRNTVSVAESISSSNFECIVLPYFGETKNDNWLLTYPFCQVAVSKEVEKDEAKQKAVLEILHAIFSEEGQKAAAAGSTVLSYNKEVSAKTTPTLRYAQDCIDSNHLYLRLASTEFFGVSLNVGQKMLKGEENAKEAYEDFNAQITAYKNPEASQVLFTQKNAYSNEFTDHGTQAGSSLMNTLRVANDDQIAIGYASVVSSPIFAGDYTMQQIKWIMTYKNDAYRGIYTGSEIRRILEWLVNVKEDGSNPIRHRNQMPITSGLEYTVTEYEKGKFRLDNITVNGEELIDDKEYSVLLVGADTYLEHEQFCNCPMPEDLKQKRQDQYVDNYTNYECITQALEKTKQLLEPTNYLTIVKGY